MEPIRITHVHGGGRALKVIVSTCELPLATGVHPCQRGHAAAISERAAHLVIHRSRVTASLHLHLHASRRQLTPAGEFAVLDLLAHWHTSSLYAHGAQPKSYSDPLRVRWLGLDPVFLDRVLADVQTFLSQTRHFMPIVFPAAGALP